MRHKIALVTTVLLAVVLALPLPALAAGANSGGASTDSALSSLIAQVEGDGTVEPGLEDVVSNAPDDGAEDGHVDDAGQEPGSTELGVGGSGDASAAVASDESNPETSASGETEEAPLPLVPQSSNDKPINGYVDWAKLEAGMDGLLGIRYIWGGCYPWTGFDCSGFVSWVEREVIGNGAFPTHVNTSADGMEQWCEDGGYTVVGTGTGWTLPSDARPGDLVFFYNSSSGTYVHVAILGKDQSVYQSWGSEVHQGGYPYGVRHMTFTETMTDGAGSVPGAKRYDSWIVFRGSNEPGRVIVQKSDADTGRAQAQGGATLKGARYLLTCTSTGQSWTLVTDSKGHAEMGELPLGSYTLKETSAPVGYKLNGETTKFTLSAGSDAARIHTCNVTDEVIKEDFEVKKVDQETREAVEGCEYTVYRYRNADNPTAIPEECGGTDTTGTWEEVCVRKTDVNGTILLSDLPFGCYRVTETCPEYHYAECGESELSSDYSYHFIVDGSHEERQTHVWENMRIELECTVSKSTIAVTSAAFRTLSGDALAVDNVANETYRYTISFDNGSTNVRADQYTVVDPCEFNEQSIRLVELYTPIAHADSDGTFNLWYQTNRTDPTETYSEASATSTNPPNQLSDGTDRIPTTGYRLWAENLDCSERTHLKVSDLKLEEGEYITALMLEYGSVEVGFSTDADAPLAYFVKATEALDDSNGEVVIRNSVASHITRNYLTKIADEETGELVKLEEPIGLYDDDEDEVETRVIDTFMFEGGNGGSSAGGTGLAQTGDSAAPVLLALMLLTAAGIVCSIVGIERVKTLFSRYQ